MNHGYKISRNHEFSRLKPWNHESREIVKGIMNHERIIPSTFEVIIITLKSKTTLHLTS